MIRFLTRIFGGVLSETMAKLVLITFIVVGLIVTHVLLNSSAATVPQPSDDLINAAQPTEGYIPQ